MPQLPTNENLLNCRLGGAVGTDRWSSGFWVSLASTSSTPAQADLDTFCALVLSSFNTNVWAPGSNPLKGVNAPGVTLDSANVIWYLAGVASKTSRATQTAVVGTAATGSYHAAASLVLTLLTDQSSRRTRGRMYLPATAPNAANATLQWALSPPYAAQMKTYFDALNAASLAFDSGNTHRVAVVSRTGSGSSLPVHQVRMDSVIDSQRGRSDKYVANFTATSTLA